MKRGIGWLTAGQKSNVLEVVQKVINAWAQEWLGNGVAPIVHLRDFSATDQAVLQDVGLLCLGTNRSIGIVTEDQQQWARALFTDVAAAIPVDTIFDYLLEQAQTALLQKLAHVSGESSSATELSRIKTIDTDGVLIILQINCGSHLLELVCDSSTVVTDSPVLLPMTQATTRLKSIHDEKIDLNIRFSLNRLGVADLVGLQVGDVIKSRHLISKPFDIVCNKQRIAGCSLGSSNGHLAVTVVSQ